MATDFTAVFGNEIKVFRQPRQVERQYAGFPGAHGVTAMDMGTRGFSVIVRGIVRATTRALCQTAIDAIESYIINSGPVDYTFYSTSYPAVVFDKPELMPDGEGKAFHWVAPGQVTAEFICYGRGLV